MLTVKPYSFTQVPRASFKSHIRENEFFSAAIKETKTDFSMAGYLNKGLATLKALRGLSEDGKDTQVEFLIKDGKVYTKLNGAIADKYTFKTHAKKGVDVQNAIINYAKETGAYSNAPLNETENKVTEAELELAKIKAKLFREMQRKLAIYD